MSRTFWTPKGLQAARDLRYMIRLDDIALRRGNEAMLKVGAAREFLHSAMGLGLEMFSEDIELVVRDSSLFPEKVLEVRWHPKTVEVELLYGPRDGQVVRTDRVGMTFASIQVPTLPMHSKNPAGIATTDTYVDWGWNPSARRWVYIYKEKA